MLADAQQGAGTSGDARTPGSVNDTIGAEGENRANATDGANAAEKANAAHDGSGAADKNHGLLRCPVCRAKLTGQEPLDAPCRRCATDLSIVRRTLTDAALLCQAARQALAVDDTLTAARAAWRAVTLVGNDESRRLLAVALFRLRCRDGQKKSEVPNDQQ